MQSLGISNVFPAKAKGGFGLRGQAFSSEAYKMYKSVITSIHEIEKTDPGFAENLYQRYFDFIPVGSTPDEIAQDVVRIKLRKNWHLSERVVNSIASGMSKGKSYTVLDIAEALVTGKSPRNVLLHEFGHKFGALILPHSVGGSARNLTGVNDLKEQLYEYGSNTRLNTSGELLAESFAQVLTQGENASPKAQKVVKALLKHPNVKRAAEIIRRGLYIAVVGAGLTEAQRRTQ
jgi:hypothetical protein